MNMFDPKLNETFYALENETDRKQGIRSQVGGSRNKGSGRGI